MMRCATEIVKVGGGADRGQRQLKGNPHRTDRFAVELLTFQLGADGHRKRQKAASDCAQVPLHKNLDRKDADATSELVGRSTPCGRWNAFVSALEKREGTLACPRCKAPMEEVVWIAPVQSEPGLIAYECPSCRYVTSVLISSKHGQAGSGPL
jgi:hypothetical protein